MHFFICLVIAALFLSSCGFKPVYGVDNDENYRYSLAEIQIAKLDSNRSYKLKNYLEDELNPNNELVDKLFILSIDMHDNVSDLLVQQDSTIITKQHNINANYILTEKSTQKIIDQGSVRFAVSFNELPSEYATYTIAEKTYDNALKELAMAIRKQLIIAIIKHNNLSQHENKLS